MEIKVTSCADCPFADELGGLWKLDYFCSHFKREEQLNVTNYRKSKELHPSCPLKQQSITVKLEENEDPRKSDYQHFSSGKL